MAFSSFSWPFRHRGSGGPSKPATAAAEADEEELGVTPQLLDFLRTLSPDTFKSSAHQLQGASVEAATGDLTGWQERHAVLVLSKAKELAKIRYDLCPRHMKDKQFWRIYFLLAKSYISPSHKKRLDYSNRLCKIWTLHIQKCPGRCPPRSGWSCGTKKEYNSAALHPPTTVYSHLMDLYM